MSTENTVTRLLLVDLKDQAIAEAATAALPDLLDPRDLVVVNDAGTLPASLSGFARGELVEVRLLEGPFGQVTRAVLFGRGDYRTRTELRDSPASLSVGDAIDLGTDRLEVIEVSKLSPRLVKLRWPAHRAARFALLYRAGVPVQYSYTPDPLALWEVQNAFAGRPWAVEMPSAGRPLHGGMLLALRRRGVPFARLTHAAGLSATGDPALDAVLPLPERYTIPLETVQTIERTRARGGRVVAVGTSVVRALEDAALKHGKLMAGHATAHLVLDAGIPLRVVSGILTGIHAPGESHYRLLSAFADADTLRRAAALAREKHYRTHEFGDAALFLPGLVEAMRRAA